jgi:catalase
MEPTIAPPRKVFATDAAPQEMVNALYKAFGDHHVRAVHAKGVLAEGDFTPTREARALSKASLFARAPVPVLLRFSNFTGIPDIADTADEANPRGLALKFALPDGTSTDIVAHAFNGFPSATAAEFRELLLALAASGPGVAKPTPLDTYLAPRPIAAKFLTTQKPAPVGYTTLSYFGVNSFRFVNADDRRTYVRYRFLPVDGEAFLSRAALAARGPDYLAEALAVTLAKGPAAFEWFAQLAESDDAIEDPSIAWPESRRLVKLGTIRVLRMAERQAEQDRSTMFLPANLPAGMEPADPMLLVRQAAYPLSFRHRQTAS